MSRSLAALAHAVGLDPEPGWDRIAIAGVTEDSRAVVPGGLFVAIRGRRRDGREFAEEAVQRGAAAIAGEGPIEVGVPVLCVADVRAALAALAAAFFGDPTRRLFTVGVTGTNGKTTVCHWAADLLGRAETVVIGTVENASRGLPGVTTPSSPIVQRIAAEAVSAGRSQLIVEASSIGLEQRRLDGVDFDVAVFTNLTHDHLDLHGTMDAYLSAKAILFRGLRPDAWAIVRADDPSVERLLSGCRARVLRYGRARSSDLRLVAASDTRWGARLTVEFAGERFTGRIPVGGPHNVENALAAAGIAAARGIPIGQAIERLSSLSPVPGRWEVLHSPGGVTAVVDYAHTPDALERVLQNLPATGAQRIVVFGCPGEGDREKRPMMGAISARHAALTVLTADNPKGEDPARIIDEIAAGVAAENGRWVGVVDRADAIRAAVEAAAAGDTILVAGKGHETYQIVGGEFRPHSDVAILRELGFEPVARRPAGGR